MAKKPEFDINDAGVLIKYNGQEKDIVVPDSVVAIADNTFAGRHFLESVVIADSVKTIGKNAFRDCFFLRKVELPKSLETIDNFAFANCTYLADIVIPNSTYVAENAFNDCISLDFVGEYDTKHCTVIDDVLVKYTGKVQNLRITNGIRAIGKNAFVNKHYLKNVVIPDSVVEIGNGAFYNCERLKNVIFSKSLKKIGNKAFYNCCNLKNAKLPDSVCYIGEYAFCNTSITFFVAPKALESLSVGIFENCRSLEKVYKHNNLKVVDNYAFKHCQIKEFDFTGVVKIGREAFLSDCEYTLINIYISETVCEIGEEAFVGTTPKTIEADKNNLFYFSDDGVLYDKLGNLIYARKGIESCLVLSGTTTICKEAFFSYKDSPPMHITLPDSLIEIQQDAFFRCNLASINIPKNVTKICKNAISSCVNLEHIKMDAENTKFCLENKILYNKNKTKLLLYANNTKNPSDISLSVKTIEENAFRLNFAKKITIASNIKKLPKSLFAYCDNLVEVDIKNGLQVIPYACFYACSNLTKINIPNSIKEIYDEAFCGVGIDCLTIPYNVKKLGYRAFAGNFNLKKAVIEEGLEIIGCGCFWDCESLSDVTIAKSVKVIERDAFMYCTALCKVKLSRHTVIEKGAFSNDSNDLIDGVNYNNVEFEYID